MNEPNRYTGREHYEILVTRNGCFEADIAPYEFEVPQTQSIQITFDSSSGIISVKGSIKSLEPTDDNENTDPDDTLSVQTLIILKSIILAFDLNNDGHFCLEDLITLWTRFQQIA